jgi:hypothetical protein
MNQRERGCFMRPSLSVARDELMQALTVIRKHLKKPAMTELILTFKQATMYLEIPGMSVGVSANGTWPGQARVPATFVKVMTSVPPKSNPVQFYVADNRLYCSSFSIDCQWDEEPEECIKLPLDPTFLDLLGVADHYSAEAIEKAGLRKMVVDAETKRDVLINRATLALKIFGVSDAELRRLVDEKVKGTSKL